MFQRQMRVGPWHRAPPKGLTLLLCVVRLQAVCLADVHIQYTINLIKYAISWVKVEVTIGQSLLKPVAFDLSSGAEPE